MCAYLVSQLQQLAFHSQVDSYMVFTVRTTIYVSEVFYQVLCRLATHTERLQYM